MRVYIHFQGTKSPVLVPINSLEVSDESITVITREGDETIGTFLQSNGFVRLEQGGDEYLCTKEGIISTVIY
jgi:hypothetical protein